MIIDNVINYFELEKADYEKLYNIYKDKDIGLASMYKTEIERCTNVAQWLKELKAYREGINEIKNKINDFKGCDMWDEANGMEYTLELLGVENDDE